MWVYQQSTGKLCHNGDYIATGYAGGNCGKNPEGVNNPAMQNVPKVGPLPQGLYTANTPVSGTHLGPYAIGLTPDPSNEMFGRSGFFMHGDVGGDKPHLASEGCIIMPPGIREEFWNSEDWELSVIV